MADTFIIEGGVRVALKDIGNGQHARAVWIAGTEAAASVQSPATAAVATVKSTAGRIYGLVLQNSAAALRSVKFYDAASVTLGTTAAQFEIDIPAGGLVAITPDGGLGFANAIKWAVTSAKGLTDNTSSGLALNDVSGAIFYA